jgi:hypothetical protein
MPTDHIIALLIAERDKLNVAIEALQGSKRRGRPAGSPTPKRKKRVFTAAQRKQQANRMKAYWAAKNKEKK